MNNQKLLPAPTPCKLLVAPITTYMYILVDPRDTTSIRYIGKTNNVRLRLWHHIRDSKKSENNYHKCCWIKSLLNEGIVPILTVIAEYYTGGNNEEIAWIQYGREEGWNLTNCTIGGDGWIGNKHTESAKLKMRISHLGKPLGELHRKSIRLAHIGKHPSDKALENMRTAQLGKTLSPEHREKLRLANLGKAPPNKGKPMSLAQRKKLSKPRPPVTDATRKKLSLARKGKPHTSEQQLIADKNTGDRLRGNPLSPEHRKKLSIANLGKHLSESQRKNMSLAQTLRWTRFKIRNEVR